VFQHCDPLHHHVMTAAVFVRSTLILLCLCAFHVSCVVQYILNLLKPIIKSGCNVLLIQKSILRDAVNELALHYLAQKKIMVIKVRFSVTPLQTVGAQRKRIRNKEN
jgi:hypothetical protein